MRRPMRLILFRLCRSEKDDSDNGSGDRIEAILMVHEAHGRICRNFNRRMAARVGSDDDYSNGVV